MKWLLQSVVFAWTLMGSAQAQQFAVRSGDHPAFSRITIALPPSQAWDVNLTNEGVIVTLPGHLGGFVTTDLFDRMRRDRIADVIVQGNSLVLKVDCDCPATAFRSGPLLVVDVADDVSSLALPPLEKRSTNEAPQSVSPSPKVGPSLPWIGGDTPFATSMVVPKIPTDSMRPQLRATSEADRTLLLQQTQEALVDQVAKAASAGLLQDSMEEPLPSSPQEQNNTVVSTPEPMELPLESPTLSNNLRITSSMDLPTRFNRIVQSDTLAGLTCPEEGFLAVETWGTDEGFSEQLGPAHETLVNARDILDKNAALSLAQLYLYFGFGAEALSALAQHADLPVDHPELAALASVFEYGFVRGNNPLRNYTDCETDVALWAILSINDITTVELIDAGAALRTLNNLPEHLRKVVAPILSDRFLQNGDLASAEAAMRSIERLPDPLNANAVMAQAAIAINAGRSADVYLEDVLETNNDQAPKALIKLVAAKIENDEPLSSETITLIASYVREFRGTELGDNLSRTQVVALGRAGEFEPAFTALESLSPSLAPSVEGNLRQKLLENLVKESSDLVFLEHIFQQSNAKIAGLPGSTKLLLGDRLLNLGFPESVQTMLATIPDRPRQTARQLLSARAALMLRQPFQAKAALIGINDTQAEMLVAQAKEMTGEYKEAAEIFATNDATDQAIQAAWLSENWRDLIPSETPRFGTIASIASGLQNTAETQLGPLGSADLALGESQLARDALQQLLSDTIVQDAPGS
ncbi:MAG: hypothetical protein WBG95_16875 [Sulfitobacter sp.]